MNATPVLAAWTVSKRYGTVQALNEVDLAVRAGTVHCLVGENGSGKSTLTKIFAGSERPDSGTLTIGDRSGVGHVSARESVAEGVRVIYQDLALFPNLSVAENLTVPGASGLLRRYQPRVSRRRAEQTLRRVGLDADPSILVEQLPVAERQLVAIARAIATDGRIILMDEPTAALTQDEIERLLALVDELRAEGLAFVFITHKLREVTEIADDVTVLRDGHVVATGPAAEFDAERITTLMTGRALERQQREHRERPDATPVVELRGGSLSGQFSDVDIALYGGRVVGLAGILGSGRMEIGLAMAGLLPLDNGKLYAQGQPVEHARDLGLLQYVPEDRLTEGLVLNWSLANNVVVNNLPQVTGRGRLLSQRRVRDVAETWKRALRIKIDDVDDPVGTLSGGNQQRALLARALAPGPDAVILSNPTVGVDVGSRAELHELIRDTADNGVAVMVISDEPAELLDVCDEIVVVRDGTIAGSWPAAELNEETIWQTITRREAAA